MTRLTRRGIQSRQVAVTLTEKQCNKLIKDITVWIDAGIKVSKIKTHLKNHLTIKISGIHADELIEAANASIQYNIPYKQAG